MNYDQWLFTLGYRFDNRTGTGGNDEEDHVHKCSNASSLLVPLLLTVAWAALKAPSPATPFDRILARVTRPVSGLLDEFSDVKCTEHVTQEKLQARQSGTQGADSTYDYLVILSNTGGELMLDESRVELKQATADRKKEISMLLTNGFAMAFLVFHPYYVNSFEFIDAGSELVNGQTRARSVSSTSETRAPSRRWLFADENTRWRFPARPGSMLRPARCCVSKPASPLRWRTLA